MSDKRQHSEYRHRRELEASGWKIRQRDAVAFNSGSETVKHAVCKMLTCYVLKERGYRIDTEVQKDNVGDIDIVAYGIADEPAFCVEVETAPTEDVIQDKIERYHDNEPYRDIFIINPNDMPVDMVEAKGWIQDQL